MAAPLDFVPIHLTCADEKFARQQMRKAWGPGWWRKSGRASWAGFAAEYALRRAVNQKPGMLWCREALWTYAYDLAVGHGPDTLTDYESSGGLTNHCARVEVKTRAVTDGWVHPDKFDYITVPMHDGREPVKDVDLLWCCWYSMSAPRVLWALGYLRGRDEFMRRSVFYKEGGPLPRGGWARGGGAYVLELSQLRPFPSGMFKEARA